MISYFLITKTDPKMEHKIRGKVNNIIKPYCKYSNNNKTT